MSIPTDAPKGRPTQWRRLVLIATITLAVAGVAFALVLKWAADDETKSLVAQRLQPRPVGPTPPKPSREEQLHAPGRPIGEDEVAFWSDFAIYKPSKIRPKAIVVVKRGTQPDKAEAPEIYQGLFAREIVREALLLSAREEFGALTRDVPIGDPDVEGKPDVTLRIGSRFRTIYNPKPGDPQVGRITIVTGTGENRRVLMAREFECNMYLSPNFGYLLDITERYAREEFKTVLEELGLPKTAPIAGGEKEAEPPPGIEERLAIPVLTEQFAAVRILHEAIRAKGDSVPLLIALSRAYANLGSLTEKRMTPDHLTFKARALLYAYRVAFREDNSPRSLRSEGYAETISGLFPNAIYGYEVADKADGGKGIQPWDELTIAYSKTDSEALRKIVAARPDDLWAKCFLFLNLERSSGYLGSLDNYCRGEIIAAGREMLAKVPDCYRVHDGMAAIGGVANMHRSTTEGFELYPTAMPKRLRAIPGLPKSALGQISNGTHDEVGFRKGLVEVADDDMADVSWGVLARQLSELRFLQVCAHLHFLAYALATSPTPFVLEALPVIADHPKRNYVACMGGLVPGSKAVEMLRKLDMGDVEWTSKDMIFGIRSFDQELSTRLNHLAYMHFSQGTVHGQELAVTVGDQSGAEYTSCHVLLKFDPNSPLGRGGLIETAWKEAQPDVAKWETDHGGDTFVLAKLGFHALVEGQDERAEKLFEKAMAQSPDRWIFDGLAAAYRKTDRLDRWTAAVEKFLKTEDQNLDHAHVAGDLADYLMSKGDYAKARPYAEISAESWAGWAMPKAARCAEAMGDWETAELWMKRTSERYANNWADWFHWCKRTGHGDARGAAELVEAQLAAGRQFANNQEAQCIAILLMLDDRSEDARGLLQRQYEASNETTDGVYLAYVLQRLHESEALRATLKSIGDDPKPSGPRTTKIAGVLASWLATDQAQPPDFQAIDATLNEMPEQLRANGCAFVGLCLNQGSTQDAAKGYLKRANIDTCYPWVRFLVMDALRAQGEDPGTIPW